MKHGEWIWALVLGGILLAGYGVWPALRPGNVDNDSFNSSAGGTKAFFLLAKELFPDVRRNSERLVPPDDADTLVLIGPARYPDPVQWQHLHDWVSSGHALILASRAGDPVVDLGPFGVRVVAGIFPDAEKGSPQEEEEEEAEKDTRLETTLAEGDIDWRSNARVEWGSDEVDVLVRIGESPQVVGRSVGEGLLIVASSDYVFKNFPLTQGDDAILAARILESADPEGTIYFDEFLNAQGPPKTVGLLFDAPLRSMTLQVLLVAVVLAWRASVRFGPPFPEGEPQRRSLAEHAVALGNLHFKVGSGSSAVRSYLEFLRSELGVRHHKADEARWIAERAATDVESVTRLLSQVNQVITRTGGTTSNATASLCVRSMASVRKKTESRKGASDGAQPSR